MLRHIAQKKENLNKIVFYQYLTCSIVAVVVISLEAFSQHSLKVVEITNLSELKFVSLMLVFLGLLCFIGQRVLAMAFQYMPAAKLAPFLYISVPISSFVGWLIWDQAFTGMMLLGTLLIVGGVCFIDRKVKQDVFTKKITTDKALDSELEKLSVNSPILKP